MIHFSYHVEMACGYHYGPSRRDWKVCHLVVPKQDGRHGKNAGASSAGQSGNASRDQQHTENPINNAVTIYNEANAAGGEERKGQSGGDIDIQRELAKFTKYLVWIGAIQAVVFGFDYSGHLESNDS